MRPSLPYVNASSELGEWVREYMHAYVCEFAPPTPPLTHSPSRQHRGEHSSDDELAERQLESRVNMIENIDNVEIGGLCVCVCVVCVCCVCVCCMCMCVCVCV